MSVVGYQFKKDFNEFDPALKDKAWADRLVTQFRLFMEPLVNREQARINRSYLMGEQDVSKYKKKFHKPEDLPFEFKPLGIFEKTRNILTAEREKAGIYLQLKALDPTAQEEKEYDKKLVQNAAFIESIMTTAQLAMGMPAYSLSNDTNEKGEKLTNGNVDLFSELKLDPNSPEDIAYFFQAHYRLDAEAEAEDAVNHFVKTNELSELLKEWCDDSIAVKAIAGRVYADEVTHTPSFKYIKPENVRWIRGQRRDGKDARAIMHEEDLTISEVLARTGSNISPENVMDLVDSVNFNNAGNRFDGISFSNGSTTLPAGCRNPCNYDTFLSMKVGLGYLEWKSIDVDTKKVGRNTLGNFKTWTMPYAWEPAKDTTYTKDQVWNISTYKCYFISRTSGTQTLFKFGKLFDMVTYGAEDEYSSFSFQVYKQPGQSAVDISIPFIDNVHDAWYRFNWILNKAKPKGTRYNYNVIAKIASKIYKEDPESNGVMKVIKMFQDSIDDFYVNDSLNPNVGGGQNPHFDRPNGLDASVKEIYQVFLDNQEQISQKLGINDVREAYSPNPNDGYKLQMQALAQSRNATEYMSRMIMSLLVNFAKHTLTILQDMIEFKGTKSYQYMERALGIKAIRSLQALKKAPLHKYGIFVESFNTDLERQKQRDEATQAWQKGEIPYHVYILVNAIDNYKKAAHVLAYEKGKEIKIKQQELERLHQQKMEEIEAASQAKLAEIDRVNKGKLRLQEETNKGLKEVAEISAQNHLDTKSLSIQSEPMKAGVRTQGKIQADEAAAKLKRGEPLETAAI